MQIPRPLSIAVLASGRGSNLQALLDACANGRLNARVSLVGSDRADAQALVRAEAAGIAHFSLDPKDFAERAHFDAALFERVAQARPDLVVLAGYMRILAAATVADWQGRMINIHPSLLPLHRGLHTHRKALAQGDAEHGSSVHFVSAELDGGPVIAQARTPVHADDDERSLGQRVLQLEHQLLPSVVALIADGRLEWQQGGPWLDGQPLTRPLDWPHRFQTADASLD
ncbi:phosphoribosylglycinamide formyltransferase [Frateuria aurantia]